MRNLITLCLLLISFSGFAQVLIHSHNDYEQKEKFHLAYANRFDQIEADVFEVNGELLVAHSKKTINTENTLEKLYLKPIDSLFKLYKGRVSKSRKYRFNLMIDFKTDFQPTYKALQKLIERYGSIFDRSKNKNAVTIIISGNRPPDSTFHTFPKWLYFDGLPNTNYKAEDFKRVTMISDNFTKYSKWRGVGEIPIEDQVKLRKVMDEARNNHRNIRFWGAPDTQECWEELYNLSRFIIINTDKNNSAFGQ